MFFYLLSVCVNKIQVRAHHIWTGTQVCKHVQVQGTAAPFEGHLDLDHTRDTSCRLLKSNPPTCRLAHSFFSDVQCSYARSPHAAMHLRPPLGQNSRPPAAGSGTGSYLRRNQASFCQELAETRGRRKDAYPANRCPRGHCLHGNEIK